MAGSIFVRPKVAPINAGGVPYSGAKYQFYLTGTSTPASVYTDSALTVAHANPVVADANGAQREGMRGPIGIRQEYADAGRSGWWEVEPDVGRVVDGVPSRVDRLRALGNAVVPQIPELIGRAILQSEARHAA